MRSVFLAIILALSCLLVVGAEAKGGCAEIKDGTILDSAGNVIETGYDQFRYNYQAHKFNGTYDSSDRVLDGTYWGDVADYTDDKLTMKWNDAWLSNKDCDGDNKLDRHYNHLTYKDSGAWLTNNVEGDYYDVGGSTCHYTYFVKIVAVSSNDNLVGGIWHDPDGVEIGPSIWGEFAIIQSVYNDPCGGSHGLEYLSPARPGLGNREDE